MKLSLNVILQALALSAEGINNIVSFVPHKYAHWAYAGISLLQGIAAVLAHFKNPDGTPAKVAYVPQPKGDDLKMVCFILIGLLAFSVGAFAQQTGDPGYEAAFNKAYAESKSPEVRSLCSIEDPNTRVSQAVNFALQGHTVDFAIDVNCRSAFNTMSLRQMYGYKWVPSLLQPPIQSAPGFNIPGLTPYDPEHAPSGSIKVSTAIEDFTPFHPTFPTH